MLTEFLAVHQDRLHLTDQEFAAHLHLDPVTWQALRQGETRYTASDVARILLAYPHALPQALEELRHNEARDVLRLAEPPAALRIETPSAAPAAPVPAVVPDLLPVAA